MKLSSFLAAAGVVTAGAALSCDADLETGCRDDACTPNPSSASSSGVGGAGGGAACAFEDTAGFPCDVYTVLFENCHGCHKPGGQGPFSLLTYDDTQAWLYGLMPPELGAQRIWARMETQVQPGASIPRMPLGNHPMDQAKIDTLNAWFATCGDDILVAGQCARGEGAGSQGGGGSGMGGGGSGMGGAGGTGGAGGN